MAAAALALGLAACSKSSSADDGLAMHQTVVVLGAGTSDERRLSVLEDARITPAMREAMWGGSKDPRQVLAAPGIELDPAIAKALVKDGFRRGLLQLTDRDGTVIARRRLDCELGQIAEPALNQAGSPAFGVGDDCSTGEGEFAGLITRFLVPDGTRIRFETYREPAGDQTLELTLVTAPRILWHLDSHDDAVLIREVSSHPDYDGPRFKSLKPGAAPPDGSDWVVEYLSYRWDKEAGLWIKSARVEKDRQWDADAAWPEAAAFPG